MAKSAQHLETKENDVTDDKSLICGIIMPIAKTDGYPDTHWTDVYSILCEVAGAAGFSPNLVSFDDDVGIIHKRIVQNIYFNPIVICDISSRNANVMLELGMRLAFDKPTIIIKDDRTPYSFDIAAIEHLEYPSDLRYQLINEFKKKLQSKIIETYKRSKADEGYTTFLKHFGTFKVAKIDEKEVSGVEYLTAELKEIKALISGASNPVFYKSTNEYADFYNNSQSTKVKLDIRIPNQLLKKISYKDVYDFLIPMGLKRLHVNGIDEGQFLISYEAAPGAPTPKQIYKALESHFMDLVNNNNLT